MNEIERYRSYIEKKLNEYTFVGSKSITSLLSICKIQKLKKGELLLQIGKISQQKHILYRGAIVSCYINSEGNVYHKNIFLGGDFVGSTVSALLNKASNFALEAIEDSIVISFDYGKFRELTEQELDLKNFYISYLEKNWVVDKEKRELDIVLKEANERYLDFITKHPEIEKRIPLYYIASHLGITPTQLSRIRRDLKEK
ncbi:cAMP-binding proteins - catabolite gene activator and regulatory subunit of cAMP-dependent protein kinases [Tenacibaculum sp. 190130A14a]|uniref:Crp/Fnr family transcriptional regulator n=1 Tax=Tenacibaculum polynesiense TaxID=3137857 RepID=A0ABP1EVP5_9FLAO